MYYILSNELEKPKFDLHIAGALVDSKGNIEPNIFGYGESVKNIADSKYSVKADDTFSMPGKLRDRLSVYIHNSIYLFIVSKKVQTLLTQFATNQVEFYPFQFDYGETIFSDYKIVNVLNKVDCLNLEESDIDFEDYNEDYDVGVGSIYTIDKLVLNTSLIPPNLNIFLLGRSIDPIIIFHESLKKQIEALNLSGFVFCLPENFQM
ncbi:MAG TPA: DUF1629 domain-containing protein [Bacteroidia bacterium]|nr:DUF1629 domain-containing protein [Bacteroidia bacterium]